MSELERCIHGFKKGGCSACDEIRYLCCNECELKDQRIAELEADNQSNFDRAQEAKRRIAALEAALRDCKVAVTFTAIRGIVRRALEQTNECI